MFIVVFVGRNKPGKVSWLGRFRMARLSIPADSGAQRLSLVVWYLAQRNIAAGSVKATGM